MQLDFKDDLNNPPLNRVGAIQLSDCEIAASNLRSCTVFRDPLVLRHRFAAPKP